MNGDCELHTKLIRALHTVYIKFSKGEEVFDSLLETFLELTQSSMGYISEIIVDKEVPYMFHTLALKIPEKFLNSLDNNSEYNGYFIPIKKNSCFIKIIEDRQLFLDNDLKFDMDKMPPHHPNVKQLMVIPLLIQEEMIGAIILGNEEENTNKDYTWELYNRLKPLIDMSCIVLQGYDARKLQLVYDQIINTINVPIIVFQNINILSGESVDNDGTTKCISRFRCELVNNAFLTKFPQKSIWLGEKVVDCFPGLLENDQIASIIIQSIKSQKVIDIESMEYEDKYIPKEFYSLKVSSMNKNTFILILDIISDKIRAKQLAEDIAKTKEEFLANVSHEIRTPLNGIVGYIHLLYDTDMTDYQRDCFETINQCSMSLMGMMNDILDFSKLNANKMTLHVDSFNLYECVESSYNIISPKANEKDLDIAYFIDPEVPTTLQGDAQKIRQILINLLSNAVKFTHRVTTNTNVKIIKNSENKSFKDYEDRYTIKFIVSDTGIGINKENQKKLFKSFGQIDQSDKKMYQGTGLGLIISQKLCHLMDGSIICESDEGTGSHFIFTIKLKESEIETEKIREKYSSLIGGRKILVVDDNGTNRIMLSSLLIEWGMTPICCSHPKEALLYITSGIMDFDMALIDIRMPEMNGNELAEEIYKIRTDLPMVALSSCGSGTDQNSGTERNSGTNKFLYHLNKPLRHKKLLQICLNIFKGQKSRMRNIDSSSCSSTPQMIKINSPQRKKLNLKNAKAINKNLKILLAEDIFINQKVAIGILQKLNYHDIDIVENGKEVIDHMLKKEYDILLLDLKMPVMDGFETATQIHLHFLPPKIPYIIALTANAMTGIREKCRKYKMDGYISKPIDINELGKMLNRVSI